MDLWLTMENVLTLPVIALVMEEISHQQEFNLLKVLGSHMGVS